MVVTADVKQKIGEEVIVVGDKVDLVIQQGDVYRTMIEDRIENGPFLVGIPSRKHVQMPVWQGDDVFLVFYRESGRYIAQMSVLATEKRGEVRYMWLLQKTLAQKNQRREAYRLPVSFQVQIFELIEEPLVKTITEEADENETHSPAMLETINSRDLSVTGIALLTKNKYVLEEKFVLSLDMERAHANIRSRPILGRSSELRLTATVKRCLPWRTTKLFDTGMQFQGVTKSMSEGIARYVLTEQQKQIKKRRLT